MRQSNWKKFIFIGLFLLGIIFLPHHLIRAQDIDSFIFPIIESANLVVKIQDNLQAQMEINLDASQTSLPALSWPLPKDAYQIQIQDEGGKSIPYNVINQSQDKLIIFTASKAKISFKINLSPQKDHQLWTMFLNLAKEPRILAKETSLKILLPENAHLANYKLYLIHNLNEKSILSEMAKNNIYEARIVLEPYSILSWEGKTTYTFQIPWTNKFILFFDTFPAYSALIILVSGLLIATIFYFFYFHYFKKPLNYEKADIPATFLENSFLMFKNLRPEAIAATLISWGLKGLINFVEKDQNKIIIGKNKDNPILHPLEKNLWDFLFKNKIQIDLEKIQFEAESKIVAPEFTDLENSIISELRNQHYLLAISLGRLDFKSTILLLFIFSLIALGTSSWIINLPWLILPPLILNIIIIFLGERLPEIIFLTNKGKISHLSLEHIKEEISSRTTNLTLDKILKELPLAVFFREEEILLKASTTCPPKPLEFFESYDPLELTENKLEKIIKSNLILAKYINHLGKL